MEREQNSENNLSELPNAEIAKWSDLNLSPELLTLIDNAGYLKPTPVQTQTTPFIMAGHDVLVSSQTGSGKTASFVLPIVEKFKGKKGTYILALAPTREIAQQTGTVFETFGASLGLKTVVCIGGASIPAEKEALATGPQIIVATPGRLCDHLERGNVWLDFIQCLVFDEADRMLEMGFAKQIDMITEQVPKERQTLMFSATYAPSVEKLARKVLRTPKEVKIGKTEGSAPKIDQRLYWMQDREKIFALVDLIKNEPGTIIIFTNAKDKVYRIWRDLHSHKFEDVTYLHSDCTQEHREKAIADFKAGKFRVLIATDVAGRGVDVDDVAHVVNYDIPREAEDYIHRIGRTGRRGKTGIATSFAIPVRDEQAVRGIERLLGIPSPELPKHGRDRDNGHNRDRDHRDSRDSRGGARRGPGPRDSRGYRGTPRGDQRDSRERDEQDLPGPRSRQSRGPNESRGRRDPRDQRENRSQRDYRGADGVQSNRNQHRPDSLDKDVRQKGPDNHHNLGRNHDIQLRPVQKQARQEYATPNDSKISSSQVVTKVKRLLVQVKKLFGRK